MNRSPGQGILELGCGTGALSGALAEQGAQVIGADLSEEMLAMAKRRLRQLRFVQGDAAILPFEEKFDTAFSNAVFYRIPNQEGLRNWICQFYENCLAAMPQASAERVLSGPEEFFPIL